MSNFYDQLRKEREEIELVKTWLEERMNVTAIRDATLEEQTQDHFDLHGCLYDENDTFEVKIRDWNYGDLLIETLSNIERQTPGWIITSLAKYLVYTVVEEKHLTKVIIIIMLTLREWWLRTGKYMNYPKHIGKTCYGKAGNLYRTENYEVPLNHLPKDIILLNWEL